MTRRKLKKAVKRLAYLPRGAGILKYTYNKALSAGLKLSHSVKVAHPPAIMLEVTNKCNLKCITCPREHGFGKEMDKGFMPFDKLKQVVDECYPYIDSIGLTGLGETMLYEHLVEAVHYIKAKSKGIIVSLSTNASLHQCVEKAEMLINKIDTIQISIDGLGDVYNKVRVNGDFDYFISNVQQIADMANGSDTDVMLNFVAVKENYHQMKDLVGLANNLKVKYLNITLYNLASDTIHGLDYYDFFQTEEFKSKLRQAQYKASEYHDFELTVWDYTTPAGFRKCHFPWTHFYITWDGWLAPCCAKPFPKELNFGNVFQTSLMTCLNSRPSQDFRIQWYQNQAPEFCKKCHFVALESFELHG
jgi:radical SAM protein with 4Fe4S-binding SPASM domain